MEVIDIIVILNKGMLEQMVNSNMVALCKCSVGDADIMYI